MVLMQYELVSFCQPLVAASVAWCTLKKSPMWTETLKHHTGFKSSTSYCYWSLPRSLSSRTWLPLIASWRPSASATSRFTSSFAKAVKNDKEMANAAVLFFPTMELVQYVLVLLCQSLVAPSTARSC